MDPFLHIQNPSDPTIESGDITGLYEAEATFEDGLELSNSDGTENDDVLGEEVELFGKTFTISEDSFDSNMPC